MRMKSFKIKKKEYADLPALLRRIGAVEGSDVGGREQAFPERTYVSLKTAKEMQRAIAKEAIKQYPWLRLKDTKTKAIVAMEWLNLGPVEQEGIVDGVILYNDDRS